MPAIITIIGGQLLRMSAPWLGILIIAGGLIATGLGGAAAWQTWELKKERKQAARAETLLDVCIASNSNLDQTLHQAREANRTNIETIRAAVLRAQDTTAQAQAEKQELQNVHETQVEQMRAAGIGNNCAGQRPGNINRLLKSADY